MEQVPGADGKNSEVGGRLEQIENRIREIEDRLRAIDEAASAMKGSEYDLAETEVSNLLDTRKQLLQERLKASDEDHINELEYELHKIDKTDVSGLSSGDYTDLDTKYENLTKELSVLREMRAGDNAEKSPDVPPKTITQAVDTSTDEGTPESSATPSDELVIYQKFQELGVSIETLNQTEGFAEMSTGKKAFVLNQLQQLTLEKGEVGGIEQFREAQKKSGFIKKMWLGMSKGWKVVRQGKELTNDIFTGKIDYSETLSTLTQMVALAPEIRREELGEKTEFIFDYASESDLGGELSDHEKQVLVDFNEAARTFNQLPHEYRNGTPEEQEIYELQQQNYQNLETVLMALKASKGASEAEVKSYGNQLYSAVVMNQFMTSNPEVEARLNSIQNDSVLRQVVGRFISMKGNDASNPAFYATMAAGGYGARAFAVGALGLTAIPLLGVGLGAIRGRATATEMLSENEKLARAGVAWSSPEHQKATKKHEQSEARNIIESSKLATKLDVLIGQIDQSLESIALLADEVEKDISTGKSDTTKINGLKAEIQSSEELLQQNLARLHARVTYTEEKIHGNLVSFGNTKEKSSRQLQLLQKLTEARKYGQLPTNDELEERLVNFLGVREHAINERQKHFKNWRTLKGALLGGTFASAGAAIAHYGNDIRDMFFPPAGAAELPTPNPDSDPILDYQARMMAGAKAIDMDPTEATGEADAILIRQADMINKATAIPDQPLPAPEAKIDLSGQSYGLTPKDIAGVLSETAAGGEGPKIDHIKLGDLGQNPMMSQDEAEAILRDAAKTPSYEDDRFERWVQAENEKFVAEQRMIDADNTTLRNKVIDDEIRQEVAQESARIDAVELARQRVVDADNTTLRNKVINDEIHQEVAPSIARIEAGAQDAKVQHLLQELRETPGYKVNAGDNVWKIIEHKLEAHKLFHDLEPGQRDYVVDYLKDKVTAMSVGELKTFGIHSGNANIIRPGENLDFSKIITEDSVDKALAGAEKLTPEQIDHIESYRYGASHETTPPATKATAGAEVSPTGGKGSTGVAEAAPTESPTAGEVVPTGRGTSVPKEAPEAPELVTTQPIHSQFAKGMLEKEMSNLYPRGFLGSLGDQKHWVELQNTPMAKLNEALKPNYEFGFWTGREYGNPDQTIMDSAQYGIHSEKAVEKLRPFVGEIEKYCGPLPPTNKDETVAAYFSRVIADTLAQKESFIGRKPMVGESLLHYFSELKRRR